MAETLVQVETAGHVARVALHDPARRNALGETMFDALDAALDELAGAPAVHAVVLHGAGKAFCAGFDLAAAAENPAVMGVLIERLSGALRRIRRLPQPVVAAVHGAAIAGGCALVSACDFVVVSATAKLGHPVHAIGVSPAVSAPTLMAAVGPGRARALLLGGEIIDGAAAKRLGLAARVSPDDGAVLGDALALARRLADHGPAALRATKAWLNELEAALDDDRFEGPMAGTAALARSPAAGRTLAAALRGRFGS